MLTMDDRYPVSSISQILLMMFSVLSSLGGPSSSKIADKPEGSYSEDRAVDGYSRVATIHGCRLLKANIVQATRDSE